jgi:hypothetical protein
MSSSLQSNVEQRDDSLLHIDLPITKGDVEKAVSSTVTWLVSLVVTITMLTARLYSPP